MRRGHRTVHARLWLLLALVLPVGLALAIALSDSPPADPGIAAVRAAAVE